MKKLNRKGFTLIELLAIIVILAIIMVVTIPTMLDMLGNATSKEFKNSADAIEKWASEQYSLAVVGNASNASTAFKGVCGIVNEVKDAAGNITTPASKYCSVKQTVSTTADDGFDKTSNTSAYNFLQAAGQKPSNYKSVSIYVDTTTNRVCVELEPSKNGDFSAVTEAKYKKSNGC